MLIIVVLGMKVFVHGGAATPLPLLDAVAKRGKEAGLKNVELIHILTEGPGEVVQPEYDGKQSVYLPYMYVKWRGYESLKGIKDNVITKM